ncbi:MAG: Mg2 transporter protein CorA family protein, magnesium transporter [Candidatus Gottesmanbacteria bacterium GW2011_GWA2_43_14]|uniref:Mg2 transporter protein CorA family protein, magnesium transporter n=1 Tax=Candidatus Gottesmanbacteria bacterium GW2011_GWA2_43_14 TaxID=1618443 RepID=A0A0G1GFQ5_9BACT|nr:MAG: Mg2 transporter protein CorA family protein, magnesium transporter [Candidatus Gottesmanbacteria bacterium GW2011_GWA2_43_14]
MIEHHKLLKIFTNPTLPVTKGIEIISSMRKKQNGNGKTLPPIQKIRQGSSNLIILRNPNEENIRHLKRIYDIHPIHLEDIVSTVQRPKIDEEEDYIFFVFHFPQYNPETNRVNSLEVDFFLTKNDLLTVIDPNFQAIEEIIHNISVNKEEKEKYFNGGPGMLLYRILDNLVDSIFPLIDLFERGIEKIDREVFADDPKNVTIQLSFLRRNVIFFQSLIKPELNSFASIEESGHPLINEELKTYFSNITDHLKKIWDRLEDVIELSNNLSQTFESYLSFKTNETIKILTMFSVILMPLTLLSGIYGMNLDVLPFAGHPLALFYITLSMIGVVLIMIAYFKIKKWI